MTNHPILYSVVIPTHARPDLVQRAARSALQPNHPSEIIVVEDHGHDADTIVQQIGVDRLRYLRNDSGQRGASATRNLGVAQARGQYIVFLDDDDEFADGYLDGLSTHLASTAARWGFGDQISVSATGAETRGKPATHRSNPFRRKIAALSAGFWIDRSLFTQVGGLDPALKVDEDTDLCCRLIGQGHDPDYRATAAMRMNRDDSVRRLTNATHQKNVAENYLATYHKNIDSCRPYPGAEAFLLLRAHRMLCRAGALDQARALRKQATTPSLGCMAHIQEVKYRLRAPRR